MTADRIRFAHGLVDTLIGFGLAPSSAFEVAALALRKTEGEAYVPFGRLVTVEDRALVIRDPGYPNAR